MAILYQLEYVFIFIQNMSNQLKQAGIKWCSLEIN